MDKALIKDIDDAIEDAIRDANRERTYIRYADIDPTEGDENWQSGHDQLIELLTRKLKEVKFLKGHSCRYDNSDEGCGLCLYCGASGLV